MPNSIWIYKKEEPVVRVQLVGKLGLDWRGKVRVRLAGNLGLDWRET